VRIAPPTLGPIGVTRIVTTPAFPAEFLESEARGTDTQGVTRRLPLLLLAALATGSMALAATGTAATPANWAGATVAAQSAATTRHFPPGLPRHLGLGLSASPADLSGGGWMADSGVQWDYAYQYLAGGVNTSGSWQNWNTNATFPLLYARSAHADGYIPVITYYEMLQSSGSCSGCREAQKDLSHLNDAALMRSYFADFATLMQRLGPHSFGGVAGYGQPAVVQVEPDLSGFAEQAVLDPATECWGLCTGRGNRAGLLDAAVSSTGYGPVAGFPNSYQGFSLALAHLRDLYAPNVLLGFHVSDWATTVDVGSDHSAALNAAGLGREAGSFAASAGADGSAYQLIFNDVADRDAAVSGHWWDQTNRVFPNFNRWESYVGAITSTTGLAAFVWQVPEGNQYYDSENDTYGHTQDNRAQYFLSHPSQLTAAGVAAVLFGRGNAGSTTITDSDHDGVTNPAAPCTSAGGASVCADHHSTVGDDDGGYLRRSGALYYWAHPAPLPWIGPTS
jgi:hypothetical protein